MECHPKENEKRCGIKKNAQNFTQSTVRESQRSALSEKNFFRASRAMDSNGPQHTLAGKE
jgi:hypothetical protein